MRFGRRTTDGRRERDSDARKAGVGIAILGMAIAITVAQFARTSFAEGVGVSLRVAMLMAWFFWAEFRRLWFWLFITIVVIAHGVALAMLPWPVGHHANKGDLMLALGDLLLMTLVGLLMRQLTRNGRTTEPNA